MIYNYQDLNIHYDDFGSGEPIVFLHGWGTSKEYFKAMVHHFKHTHRVLALDFPGFGASDEPNTPWSVSDYCAMTQAFFDELDIVNPRVVGHSFGGRVIIKMAETNDFKQVVLTGAAGIREKAPFLNRCRLAFYKTIRFITKVPGFSFIFNDFIDAYRAKYSSADYKSASDVMRQTLVKVVNEDLQKHFKRNTSPTLLIWGDQDMDTPLWYGQRMEKKMPHASLIIFEGKTHYAYLEEKDRFNTILESFFKEVD